MVRRGGALTVTTEHRRPSNGPDIERLFERLANSADDLARARLRRRIITECLPIADHIACRFVGRGEPSDDLIQVARVGLIKTVDRYDPRKGDFLPFAAPTIRGEIRRHFRDNTWTVRVPRKVQETQLRVREAVNTLSQRLSRPPTSNELADELCVGSEEISDSQVAGTAYRPVSLDAPVGTAQDAEGDTVGSIHGADDPGYDRVEDLVLLQEAIGDLDPRRRAIVGMIFFDCLSQREVASRLHVSQVQISRLLNDALARLRLQINLDAAATPRVVGPFIGTV
ncbi:SigB/SigF/SigG family RNA polymerase sigma factor [Mycobacterium doricum]|nr:SigB/SigF/SigG family RNA polymerase sigma factor [Mycolicibacterium doricum]